MPGVVPPRGGGQVEGGGGITQVQVEPSPEADHDVLGGDDRQGPSTAKRTDTQSLGNQR
jgi:hypothetical protein